jgi:excisionase family DNA binding protein
MGNELLTPQEAARIKGVSVTTIYRAINEGRLPSQRVLGRLAVSPADVEAFEPGSYAGIRRTVIPRGRGGHAAKTDTGGTE